VRKVTFDLRPAHHKADEALHEHDHEQAQGVRGGAGG